MIDNSQSTGRKKPFDMILDTLQPENNICQEIGGDNII